MMKKTAIITPEMFPLWPGARLPQRARFLLNFKLVEVP